MSEAERVNNEPGLPESSDPVPSVPPYIMSEMSEASELFSSPGANDEEGWETVDFPGALSVDAIPRATELVSPVSSEISPDTSSEVLTALAALGEAPLDGANLTADLVTAQLHRFQQENGELRDRLVQLEQDLTQQQIEFQLEVARSLHTPEAIVPQSVSPQPAVSDSQLGQELSVAQERVNELLQELEISKQVAQRQRILAETLTEQLDSSQERVAQLERDCALAQQRYNEQVQQLLQTENTCRDLRMRLHRQQRQTLQFKAALEKCLEMTPAQRQSQFIPSLTEGNNASAPVVSIPPTSLSQVLAPKNQPVRPWSAAAEAQSEADDTTSTPLPKPLSKLLHPNAPDGGDGMAGLVEEPPASEDWVSQIFHDTSATEPYQPVDGQPSNTIFDLTPFLDDQSTGSEMSLGETTVEEVASSSQVSQQGDSQLLQMLAAVPLDSDELGSPLEAFSWGQSADAEDGLWDDLAKLIEPPAIAEKDASSVPFPLSVESSSGESAVEGEAGKTVNAPSPIPLAEADQATGGSDHKPLDLVNWAARSGTPRSNRRSIGVAPNQVDAEGKAAPAAIVADSLPESANPAKNQEMLSGVWPSPVVYPLRPSRKLKSLAAVDLPSFPKAR